MTAHSDLEIARTIADAVLYEGYLLYPYRASSQKNQSRWQFGVLGPIGAAAAGLGEESTMSTQCVVSGHGSLSVTLRFLQLQVRSIEKCSPESTFTEVSEMTIGSNRWLSWDEAISQEITLDRYALTDLTEPQYVSVEIPGGRDCEFIHTDDGTVAGRIVRTRWPLTARVSLRCVRVGKFFRLEIAVDNVHREENPNKDNAIRRSFIGAHLVITCEDAAFVSLLEPPDDAADVAASCTQSRCFPVLSGAPGATDVVLASPIILYDYPEIAAQSDGALFDSTEIDEILTLRIMTMTDDEKAQARATDPLAAQIIDRCEAMSPESLQQLHGVLHDPGGMGDPGGIGSPEGLIPELPQGVPWWDPEADTAVRPDVDAVLVDGVRVSKGCLVRLRPSRRADAQDLFSAGRTARVATVHADVDGDIHVGVTLLDDPAADLHDWYGRYLYFAPDEIEPLEAQVNRKESQP
ncbi:hypothetical protein QMK17_15335 [Rhodococcus sp. G-MC3]|uniref:hypothetical protein n=1 Tax=Rhodococcus sp. G-MC3 TaxID=3046209 RepID=UPI0024B89C74|nr:hypothetical protein [Rhodococcus sp. G-MC3]MDJ0394697.1 hypothetical protein [Rhodococcus sp. G-MC3]